MPQLRWVDRELLKWDESKHPRDRRGRFTFSIGSPVVHKEFLGNKHAPRDLQIQKLKDKADRIGSELWTQRPYEPTFAPEFAVQALYDANEYGILVPEYVHVRDFGEGQNHIPAAYEVSEQGLVEINIGSPVWDDPDDAEKEYLKGWWSQPSLLGLVHHEMGHHGHLNEVGYDEYEGLMKEGLPYELKEEVQDRVSIYGSTSPTEFVAEVIAGHMSGIDYPSDIMHWYSSYGGPRLDIGLAPKNG